MYNVNDALIYWGGFLAIARWMWGTVVRWLNWWLRKWELDRNGIIHPIPCTCSLVEIYSTSKYSFKFCVGLSRYDFLSVCLVRLYVLSFYCLTVYIFWCLLHVVLCCFRLKSWIEKFRNILEFQHWLFQLGLNLSLLIFSIRFVVSANTCTTFTCKGRCW